MTDTYSITEYSATQLVTDQKKASETPSGTIDVLFLHTESLTHELGY